MRTDRVSKYLRVFTGKPLFKKSPLEPLLTWEGTEKSGAYKFSFIFSAGSSAIVAQYKDIDILLCDICTTENNTLPATDAEVNAFHGLGVYAFKVWRALLAQPAKSLYEIAKRLSVSPHTVKATVTRLVSAGLVVFSQSEGLYIGNQLTDGQLAIVAADRGTQNKAQEKRQRFTLEREKHANKLVFEAKSWYKRQSAKMLRLTSAQNTQISVTKAQI
jgi:DNA-binding transcriptional regulator YhcF (GntR family)